MDWPRKPVMHLLIDICAGQDIEPVDGVLTVHRLTKFEQRDVQYEGNELDELEERRWIDLSSEVPALTDQGFYAVEKYARQVYGVRLNPRTLRPAGSLM